MTVPLSMIRLAEVMIHQCRCNDMKITAAKIELNEKPWVFTNVFVNGSGFSSDQLDITIDG